MSDSGWVWDPTRASYYIWSAEEDCYIYQNGTRIRAQPENLPSAPPPDVPRSSREAEASHTFANQRQSSQSPYASYAQPEPGSAGPSNYAAVDSLTRQLGGMNVNQDSPQYDYGQQHSSSWGSHYSGYPASSAYAAQSSIPSAQTFHSLPTSLYTGPPEDITDGELFQQGAKARGLIKGTQGDVEELDAAFFIRKNPRIFFVVGRVIKILWPELPGNNVDGMTVVSDAKFEKEKFITKIRWFIVVKEGRDCCTCVPVSTYGKKGCGKAGTAKWQHCIVYTGKEPPGLLQGEAPGPGEQGMLTPIRVKPTERGGSMYKQSRINFAKLYTVEHNVKVYDFGKVHERFLSDLVNAWDYVFRADLNVNPRPASEQTSVLQPLVNQPLQTVVEDVPSVPPGVPPIHGSATSAWTDTRIDDQLHFQPGDRIFVESHVSDDWSKGRNESTRKEGIFPRGLVTLDPPAYATALYDQKYDKKIPGRLAFSRGDRILRLSWDSATMDKGRNETTNKEGRYQYNHVKMDTGRYAFTVCKWVDEESPDQLKFLAQDRILVTHWPENSLAWGRNERTGREGRFPREHVKFD